MRDTPEYRRMAKVYTLYACIPPTTSMDDPRVVELNQMLAEECCIGGVSISAPELLTLLIDYEIVHDEDDRTLTFYGRWEEDRCPYFVIHENDSEWAYIHRWIPGWYISGGNLVCGNQRALRAQWMATDYNTRYMLGLMFSDLDNPFMLEWYVEDDAWTAAIADIRVRQQQQIDRNNLEGGLNGYID